MHLLSISFENEYHDNIADFNIAISLDKEELKNLFEQIKSELDDYNLNKIKLSKIDYNIFKLELDKLRQNYNLLAEYNLMNRDCCYFHGHISSIKFLTKEIQ